MIASSSPGREVDRCAEFAHRIVAGVDFEHAEPRTLWPALAFEGAVGAGVDLVVALFAVPVLVFVEVHPADLRFQTGCRVQAAVAERVAAQGEAGDGAGAHRADRIAFAFGEVEDRIEEAVVLVGDQVRVDPGRVDAGECSFSIAGERKRAGGADLGAKSVAASEPLLVAPLITQVGVEGGVCFGALILRHAFLVALAHLLQLLRDRSCFGISQLRPRAERIGVWHLVELGFV